MTDEALLLDSITNIARRAGAEIMEVYNREGADSAIAVQSKADHSPLTEADTRAHELIVRELDSLSPALPVLSEESQLPAWSERQSWSDYWLVDPLDGTKEFINRNDEFTVNIARIRQGRPVMGVVHVPALAITYTGSAGTGAWKQAGADESRQIQVSALPGALFADRHSKSMETDLARLRIRVVASRRHKGEELQAMLDRLEQVFAGVDLVSMGSSLKICLVAEGTADFYPRLAPTSEWDTAAAHAVLSAAGGEIYDRGFEPLSYNQKDDILNPHFLAMGDRKLDWRLILNGI